MVQALYFDGQSASAQPVQLAIEDHALHAIGESASAEAEAPRWQWPLKALRWPERTRHGQRVIDLPEGGSLVVADATAFDAWRTRNGHRDSWIVRAQQRWGLVLAASLLTVMMLMVGYRWGVPAVASGVVALVPMEVERQLGDAVLENLDKSWFAPTQLTLQEQQAWRQRFAQMLKAAHAPGTPLLPYELHFRRGGDKLGANALALPGNHMLITDELLELLDQQEDTLLGVLAHEYGHLEERHGMKAVAQFGLVSLAVSVTLGDFSSVLATLPVLFAQASYSRDAERQADATAARLLKASGRSPEVMLVLFEKLRSSQGEAKAGGEGTSAPRRRIQVPIAFASHPADEERVRFFRDAAKP